jgi:hypothetical protein
MKKIAFFLILTIGILSSGKSFALTNLELLGNYTLKSFSIQYTGYSAITQASFSSFSGRASVSSNAFLMEMSGTMNGQYIWRWSCGFYTISGNQAIASLVGEATTYVTVSLSGNTMTTSGSDYDNQVGQSYNYTYVWEKTENIYSQSQLDLSVSSAIAAKNATIAQRDQTIVSLNAQIASMYSQAQLSQAVADAQAEKDTIITQKDQTIAALNAQMASMFTQTQLDQALAERDLIIGQKEQMITSLNTKIASMYSQTQLNQAVSSAKADTRMNDDGVLNLADIIFGLQVMTNLR